MHVELDHDSKKWIEAKGNELTVKMLEVKGCCAPGVQDVVAVPGKPKAIEQYNEMKVDNLLIYVQKNLCAKEKLTLTMSGTLFLKSISAKLQ